MAKHRIIIDTDPGQDDAVAILLALASPEEIEVLGLTAVAGNVPLELTALNARKVCELAGRPEMQVFAGCDRPLRRDLVTARACAWAYWAGWASSAQSGHAIAGAARG